MWKNNEIFRKCVFAAKNHHERAKEGLDLLEQGRSLENMSTEIEGLSEEETKLRRQEYITSLDNKNTCELEKQLNRVENLIEIREQSVEKGTSELNWQRLQILEKLGK